MSFLGTLWKSPNDVRWRRDFTNNNHKETTRCSWSLEMASKSPLKFWRLYCPKAEVRLDITLKCGQSFRWKLLEQEEGGEEKSKSGEKFYIGVVRRRVWVIGRDGEDLLFSCVNGNGEGEEEAKLKMELEDYLQLKVKHTSCYEGSPPEIVSRFIWTLSE